MPDGITTITSTSTGDTNFVTEYPSYIVGDILFYLGIIIFLQTLMVCGIFFNTFTRKPK